MHYNMAAFLALALFFQLNESRAEPKCAPQVDNETKKYDFGTDVEKARTLQFPGGVDGSVAVSAADLNKKTLTIQASNGFEGGQAAPKDQDVAYCNFGVSIQLKASDPNYCAYVPLGGESAALVSWELKAGLKKAENDGPHVLVNVVGIRLRHPKGPDGSRLPCDADLSIFHYLGKLGSTAAH